MKIKSTDIKLPKLRYKISWYTFCRYIQFFCFNKDLTLWFFLVFQYTNRTTAIHWCRCIVRNSVWLYDPLYKIKTNVSSRSIAKELDVWPNQIWNTHVCCKPSITFCTQHHFGASHTGSSNFWQSFFRTNMETLNLLQH